MKKLTPSNCPMLNLNSRIGERVEYLRTLAGESLRDVAISIGCSKSYLWELEKGSRDNPTLNVLRALAIHFNVSIRDLADNEETAAI